MNSVHSVSARSARTPLAIHGQGSPDEIPLLDYNGDTSENDLRFDDGGQFELLRLVCYVPTTGQRRSTSLREL